MDEALMDLADEAYEAGDYETAIILKTVCAAMQYPPHKTNLTATCIVFSMKALSELQELDE